MAKALFATAYAAIVLYFLRGYLPRPTMQACCGRSRSRSP
jgi:hypothetical protein